MNLPQEDIQLLQFVKQNKKVYNFLVSVSKSDLKKDRINFLKEAIDKAVGCDLMAICRNKNNVRGRVIFARVCRHWGIGVEETGRYINRDHSTIIHYSEKYKSLNPKKDDELVESIIKFFDK